jgi:ribosomal protein L30E
MGLFLAWLVSILAIVATQYASIVFSLPVCQLCWYQRICIYPLAVVLGIGAFQNDARAVVYGIPLSALLMASCVFALNQHTIVRIPNEAHGVPQAARKDLEFRVVLAALKTSIKAYLRLALLMVFNFRARSALGAVAADPHVINDTLAVLAKAEASWAFLHPVIPRVRFYSPALRRRQPNAQHTRHRAC